MKYLLIFSLFLPVLSHALNRQACGINSIEQVITGTRHGALLYLSDKSCGNSGYVCIDLGGDGVSLAKAKAAYSFSLAMYVSSKKVQITVDLDSKPSFCGGNYPEVEDIRNEI